MAGMKTQRTDLASGNQRALAMLPSDGGFHWVMKRQSRRHFAPSANRRVPGDDSSDLAGRLAVTTMRMNQRRQRNLDFYLLAAVAAVCAMLVAVFGFR